jgi:N utilization substance protein A
MSIVKSEFALALNQVATERGITPEEVIESIELAILAAYKKEMSESGLTDEELDEATVKIKRNTGEAHVLDKDGQDITPSGFGRIAAQTAKQVILQKIREVEKKTVLSQYTSQIGTSVKGRVIRYDGFHAFVDIGKTEAFLPREEQIRSEKYNVNDAMVFYIKEISEDKFGNSRIVLSRSDDRLITELFKKEVPEVASGTVEIKRVVREPGERAKIAVYSNQGGVDPVGACVGQKGVRVQMVTNELGGSEKIDIIQWNEDPIIFITAAIQPAQTTKIEIDAENHAVVTVSEDQAPLAIGRGGVNVNLASKLTGYELDIQQIPSDKPAVVEDVTTEESETATDEAANVPPDATPAHEDEAPADSDTPQSDDAETEEASQEEPVVEEPVTSEVEAETPSDESSSEEKAA